jgi:tRNA-dihydrouridine synthase A
MDEIDRTISWAPMMGYSDRHARALMRLISPNTLLFTEMVVASALLMGDKNRFLQHAADEPCALQLGGSEPKQLSEASQLSEQAGYQEINLNVGCPSDRVQQGEIGACLMGKPNLVAECISAMQAAVEIPVTVKCRIGIDDQDSFDHFRHFIETVSSAGCDVFYVHARAAWLQGLSPKENREIPPLKYHYVADIQKEFPNLTFILNGGIKSADEALNHLKTFSGVMMGRAIYKDPFLLAELESKVYGHEAPTRREVIDQYVAYGKSQKDPARHVLKHLLSLFTNQPGARQYRRYLSENMNQGSATLDMVYDAMETARMTRLELSRANQHA